MTDPAPPPRGHMVLYDRMDPPLTPGDYRLRVETTVTLSGATLPNLDRHFTIEGPRFRLANTEVVGVYPPRNAQGPFTDALAQVTLGRRTLPWERSADPSGSLSLPARPAGAPPAPQGAPPWLALLLFDETESEVSVLADQLVKDVLPASVRAVLAAPEDATCDAIDVDATLLAQLLPSLEELHLLAHVRQVNIEDRELSADDFDGWFSVVVCARVPLPDRKYRACLVSLEGRTDLIRTTPPAVAGTGPVIGGVHGELPIAVEPLEVQPIGIGEAIVPISAGRGIKHTPLEWIFSQRAKLVLLHSWSFECTGTGTFQQLAENLDVGLIGDVRSEWPKMSDTGHLTMDLRDRAGAPQTVWYRGPLAPFPISRDTRGPYHSADQARRISPETGLEDISYAAAFEVGRLLAAADGRLAQELMRWRRGDYRRSVELRLKDLVRLRFPALLDRFRVPDLAADLIRRWQDPRVQYSDLAEIGLVAAMPGLLPENLATAWGITATRATSMLSLDVVALASSVDRPTVATPGEVTIDSVARDLPALERLAGARERFAPSGIDAGGFYERGGRR